MFGHGTEDVRALKERTWRAWYEGWTGIPLAMRSTGRHVLRDEYFDSVADYIDEVLELDPNTDAVLDIGCDNALVSRRIAPRCRNFECVGVDCLERLCRMVVDEQLSSDSHMYALRRHSVLRPGV